MRHIYISISLLLFLSFQSYDSRAQGCWSTLGTQIQVPHNFKHYIECMAVYNGELVVAGEFDTIAGVVAHGIAKWNGSSWSPLGAGINRPTSPVILNEKEAIYGLAVYNGELYVCGTFDNAGGIPVNCIAKWDGNSWSNVGTGIILSQYQNPIAMAVYNGSLYVGGRFDTVGGIAAANIAKWDGTAWSAVGSGLYYPNSPTDGYVSFLIVYNNMLIASGAFPNAGGLSVNNIASWDGNIWSSLGSGISYAIPSAMISYQGDLYVTTNGYYGNQNSLTITKWNGTSWSNVLGGPGSGVGYYGVISSFISFDSTLLAAGAFSIYPNDNSGNFNTNVGLLNDTTFSQWVNLYAQGDIYTSMIVYDNNLFVSGRFDRIDTTPAHNIAERGCATGIKDLSQNHMNVYPNPNKGLLTIHISNFAESVEITIYDLLGKVIRKQLLSTDETELDIRTQSPGMYLYRINRANDEPISSGSFILE